MKHILLLSILLAPSGIHAMKNTLTDKRSIIDAMEFVLNNKEIITYKLAPLLDRQDRAKLRIINKNYAAFIKPQHIINQQYKLACLNKDTEAINEWRRKGALNPDEEIYKLFLDNKRKIIRKIIPYNYHDISNIFFYGIQQDNVIFMQWLLDTTKPCFNSYLAKGSLERSKQLNRHEITQLFESYIKDQSEKDWNRTMNNVTSSSDPIEYIQYDNAREQNCIIS